MLDISLLLTKMRSQFFTAIDAVDSDTFLMMVVMVMHDNIS